MCIEKVVKGHSNLTDHPLPHRKTRHGSGWTPQLPFIIISLMVKDGQIATRQENIAISMSENSEALSSVLKPVDPL
jgi:hypothetical protein